MMLKTLSLLTLTGLLSFPAIAIDFDKLEKINGVDLKSGKSRSIRHYQGKATKVLPFDLNLVKSRITNYEDKCNNDYRSKRKFTNTEKVCKYHNDHLIESFIVRTGDDPKTFLVGRQIYNRAHFSHYDLIQIQESKNEKGQKTVVITQDMLNDDEVKKYLQPKFKKDSAFIKSSGVFTLTEIDKSKTEVTYEYYSETDHWLLNKEISVPQVFASISNSISELFKSVEGGTVRDLASR